MFIALDSNILVAAHVSDHAFHAKAFATLRRLAMGDDQVGIPWPCIYEFLAVVTNPKIFKRPSPVHRALDQVQNWVSLPDVKLLSEEGSVAWGTVRDLVSKSDVVGGHIHDAKIVSICLIHAVDILLTADRDFSRFPQLRTRNPLVE